MSSVNRMKLHGETYMLIFLTYANYNNERKRYRINECSISESITVFIICPSLIAKRRLTRLIN